MNVRISRTGYLALAAALAALDQAVKAVMTARLSHPLLESIPLIPGCLELEYSMNAGIAFGMFKGMRMALLFLTPAVGAVLAFFILTQPASRLSLAGLSMMLAGAAGNFIDRARLGYVVDFIHFYLGSFSWPNFNVADALIVVGVGLFALGGFGGAMGAGARKGTAGPGSAPGKKEAKGD